MLQKDEIALEELANRPNYVDDVLSGVDEVSDGVEDLNNQDNRIDQCDRQPDAGRGLGDLCDSACLKLGPRSSYEPDDFLPRVLDGVDEVLDLFEGALDLDDSLLESDVSFEMFPRVKFRLRGVEKSDSCLEDSGEVLDDSFSEIEEVTDRRKAIKKQLEQTIQAKSVEKALKNTHVTLDLDMLLDY